MMADFCCFLSDVCGANGEGLQVLGYLYIDCKTIFCKCKYDDKINDGRWTMDMTMTMTIYKHK